MPTANAQGFRRSEGTWGRVSSRLFRCCPRIRLSPRPSPSACSERTIHAPAGCRRRELVPIRCHSCRKTYCLAHRLEADHSCEGKRATLARAATEQMRKSLQAIHVTAPPTAKQRAALDGAATTLRTKIGEMVRALDGSATEDVPAARKARIFLNSFSQFVIFSRVDNE